MVWSWIDDNIISPVQSGWNWLDDSSVNQAIEEGYELAIFDDGLQDPSINYDYNLH